MYRLTFLTALLLTISNLTSAQSDWWFDSEEREREITGVDKRSLAERSFKERLTFGGSGALQFGTNTVIGGAPQVGYRINESLLIGVGGTYYFQRFKQSYGNVDQNFYGGNVFARHRLLTRIFAHVEWEHINQESGLFIYPISREWTSMFWVGAGYYRGLTDQLGAGFTVLYDVTENPLNPYQNPTFRGGLSIGF